MITDGAAHHFDMLRNLTGANCEHMAALEWNPAWSSSAGDFNALCLMRMANGTRATYEGNATAAGEQNGWRHEYYRAECEDGSVSVGFDQVVRSHRYTRSGGLMTEEVAAPAPAREAHSWIVSEFLDWLDGGPTPATSLDDNIHTAAMIFGAIEAAHTGQSVNVTHMLDEFVRPGAYSESHVEHLSRWP
jgi:predicted dehydrogenase